MADTPTVSILIPTLNEAATIDEVLACAAAQDYPAHRIEVVVADGGSSDGTVDIVRAWADRLPSLRIVDNPDVHQSAGINLAASVSTGDILVRWDAHATYPVEYVSTAVELLDEPGVDVVGGHWDPVGRDRFGRWSAGAMASRLGVGSDRYAPVAHRRTVDTVSCGVMRRTTFEAVGGFDTSLRPAGEDADIMFRIRQGGGTIVLEPAIRVEYHPRSTADGLVRQYYGYGIAKALILAKHRTFPSLRPLAPAALVAVLGATVVSRRVRRIGMPLLVGYGTALVVGTSATTEGPPGDRIGTAMAASIMHLSYGAGLWTGVLRIALTRRAR